MASHAGLVDRYKGLRAKSRELSNRLAEAVPKDAFEEVVKRLQMARGREVILETYDELAVLMDCAIFDIRRNGENLVQRFLRERPPAEGTDERMILEGMCSARHSIFRVLRVERGSGVLLLDGFRQDHVFVWDVGFSQTARRGAILACRIYSVGEVTMTTGAGLPIDREWVDDLGPPLKRYENPVTGDLDISDPQTASDVAIVITRECIKAGASARIAYADVGEANQRSAPASIDPADQPTRPIVSGLKIGRNDPCPCGSGKKYKKCCGR
ncbi:MAG TPA: SEC-C metal-binding domain-containing protein [Tepidisphaeraceae bacterium]|nr:SEC-C metal-binding domain-containing protein [Tepidisphaeraceae bacterium]